MTDNELSHVHATAEGVATREFSPPHPPRVETPAYRKAHNFLIHEKKAPCVSCGIAIDTLSDPTVNLLGSAQMETHHYPIERSLMNACDPLRVHKDFPVVYDAATLEVFVDSPANLIVLCLTGDTLVLMGDGSQKTLASIHVGDAVIGKDGKPHRVTATMNRSIEEDIVEIDGTRMTTNHPVLTQRGWIPAGMVNVGELVYHISMVRPQMFSVTTTEFEILNSVIGLNSIDVMNAFRSSELPTKMLLHDPPMLKVPFPFSIDPHLSSDVPFRTDMPTYESFSMRTRQTIETLHPTRIRAKPFSCSSSCCLNSELCTTHNTTKRDITSKGAMFSFRSTFGAACNIPVSKMSNNKEIPSTYATTALHSSIRTLSSYGFWRPINHIQCHPFKGSVYDISIAHSHSFVANGMVVHNCDVCHRSTQHGIHHLLTQDWIIQKYLYTGYIVAGDASDVAVVLAHDEAIEALLKQTVQQVLKSDT